MIDYTWRDMCQQSIGIVTSARESVCVARASRRAPGGRRGENGVRF